MTDPAGSITPDFAISDTQRAQLETLIAAAPQAPGSDLLAEVERIAQARASEPIFNVVEGMREAVARHAPEADPVARRSLETAVVASLVCDLPARLGAMDMPASLLEMYPETVDRLIANLCDTEARTEPENLGRDLLLSLCLYLPAGAQDIHLNASRGAGMFLREALRTGRIRVLAGLLRIRAGGGLVDIHTDSRYTTYFNPEGWDKVYHRAADWMKAHSRHQALAATSWFYDPALQEISPRLAYLAGRPLEGGAYRIRNGPGAIHTERATKTSRTRRRLYEEGAYIPTCYTIIWMRGDLIRWSERNSTSR